MTRIMIVEDETIIANDIKTRLQNMNYTITSIADTGQKAVKKANEDRPDLILMDIQLKDRMDGIEASQLIRSRLNIPIIFLTAHADHRNLERAKNTKPYGYILKPFKDTDLKITIEMALYTAKVNALRRHYENVLFHGREKYRALSEMLRLMCDNVPDLIWAKDLEKRYIFVNKAVCRNLLNAADTDEPIGKTDVFFAEREKKRHPNNPQWHTFGEICRDTDAITMDAGTPQRFDEYGNVQGKFLFLDVHKAPFLDENGKIIGTVGSARDVTAAKEMENRLKESEDRLKNILQNMPVMMDAFDENGVAVMWNHECEMTTGYCAEEIIGNPKAIDLLIPDPSYRKKKMEELFKKDGNYRNWEWEITCKDGTRKIISWSNISKEYPINGLAGWGIGIDVTDRKATEKAVENAKKQWEETFDAITDWVCIIDKNFTIVRSNKASQKYFGRPPQDIVGKRCCEIVHGTNDPISGCPLQKTVNSRQREEFEFQTKNDRWWHVLVEPIESIQSNNKLTVHVLRDITDTKIREQKVLISRKAEAFKILAGGLAHDYNNLLMAIWGNISLLKDEIKDAMQQELIEESEKACELARSLTHKFLSLSKSAVMSKSECNIEEILNTAVRKTLSTPNIDLSFNYTPVLPKMELDLEQMLIVFQNIIVNALEAMPDGGKLNISTAVTSPGNYSQEDIKFVEISFEDTGRGIPESDLIKLFDPYFTTKSMGAQKGVGLGLAAAQAIVNRHGGNIHISSAPGKGTTVIVSLPIEQSSFHGKADINIYPLSKTPVILMMEDEISLRKLCRRMLQKLNCEIITTCNGNEMIESYKTAVENNVTIDLVILDQNIKGGAGGFEILDRLKKEGFDKNAILVTGSPHESLVDNLKKYGFDDLISKPYTKKEFETIIRKYLPV